MTFSRSLMRPTSPRRRAGSPTSASLRRARYCPTVSTVSSEAGASLGTPRKTIRMALPYLAIFFSPRPLMFARASAVSGLARAISSMVLLCSTKYGSTPSWRAVRLRQSRRSSMMLMVAGFQPFGPVVFHLSDAPFGKTEVVADLVPDDQPHQARRGLAGIRFALDGRLEDGDLIRQHAAVVERAVRLGHAMIQPQVPAGPVIIFQYERD